ncbi:hypothetical protein CIL05_10330 [Virgibacillus profundi]|uniref:MobA-like NTP transferase domain-containing protein n=1 Tax=Virgibacillus profundi TaxID=2024555 RepID=A0A2A2IES4_9BACI|nr:nucleotidyltransferase family protein [Virgibacillus profundi]PAV29754.1 hypothetical protein CIL05_10330 [Virgibacillus profundi]PXY53926.1 nucleotidyltransferase family protein [Virgibacillus profundi]
MTNSGVSAIMLAAGLSSRMGTLKALLPWQGIPLIQFQIEQMQKAGINEIIIVLGYQAEQLREITANYDVITVTNKNYEQGKSSSIRKGAAYIKEDTEGVFVSAVDQPVSSHTLRKLSNHLKKVHAKAVIPVYQNKHGHPILFHGSLKTNLLAVNEKTKGLRNVIREHSNQIAYLPVNDSDVLLNFNNPDDYMNSLQGGLK